MNANRAKKTGIELPTLLSTLWIFLSLNYILCDVLSNMEMEALNGLLIGNIGGIELTQGFILIAGISLEIPFLMVVLSRILPFKSNRMMNMIVPVLMIVYQLGSFAVGTDATLHYMFFSAVEILANLVILGLAIKWKPASL
ncbi:MULTISPECIES: DUF6326 family protein [unclassified Fusibacter]|uniref:DUF6326 family protein n=1 Tax=unclassified Fusibacter TaxID=2624464 RepID=UPI0010130D1F|nr:MULTISPECIES: DUF6326 family protein [unclassified Fusibacter]MCK8060919.1 DUF6326 family protein [Fusibacter sp. A2]NPE23215.1 hypothetical protein [Fusibacter sp. A1]RXV59571.1 hypothetical protein DWB64_15395 [Fusibacter sp. A1]